MTVRTKDRGTGDEREKKNHHTFICPWLILPSGWLIHAAQYRRVEMATLIDVPASRIFHSH